MNSNTQIISNYIHNHAIPGWNAPEILEVLAKYADSVEENGTIVELGGFFGRSTYTLGKNKKDSVNRVTLDVWPTLTMDQMCHPPGGVSESALMMSRFNGIPLTIKGDDFHNLWKYFTKGIVNNVGIKENVSTIQLGVFPMIDILYHDAGHTYRDVFTDLTRWLPKVKPNGTIIVDDYDKTNWPGVVQAVDEVVQANDLYTEMVTSRNILLKRKV